MRWVDQAVIGVYAITAGLLYRKLRGRPLFEDSWVGTWRHRARLTVHPQTDIKERPVPADVVIVEYSAVNPRGEAVYIGSEEASRAFLEAHTKRAATPGTYLHSAHATYTVYRKVLDLDPAIPIPAEVSA